MDKYARTLRLYTDGSAWPNPNSDRGGGWGWTLCLPDGEGAPLEGASGRSPDAHTTNNRMELRAACYGLQHVLGMIERGVWKGGRVELWTDSQYVIGHAIVGYVGPATLNYDLVTQLRATISLLGAGGTRVVTRYVRGHTGDPGNEAADQLAGLWREAPAVREAML